MRKVFSVSVVLVLCASAHATATVAAEPSRAVELAQGDTPDVALQAKRDWFAATVDKMLADPETLGSGAQDRSVKR